MADLQAEVPQQIEHVLDDALAPGGLLVGQQEQEIDVGAGREQAAAVAAVGDDGHALGGGRVLGAVDVGDGEVVDEPDQLVLEGGQAFGASPAVAVPLELGAASAPRLMDELAQALDEGRAERGILPGISTRKPRRLFADRVEVEIGRGFDDGLVHASAEFSIGGLKAR